MSFVHTSVSRQNNFTGYDDNPLGQYLILKDDDYAEFVKATVGG